MGARDLLHELESSGFSVQAEGDRLMVRPASRLTDDLRAAVRESKPELLRLLAGQRPAPAAWSDDDIERFLDRRNRLMRWGWTEPDADALAERLTRRDRSGDDRVSCTDCRHFRPGRCGNHRRAGLHVAEVGRDLAATLQRCEGFSQ